MERRSVIDGIHALRLGSRRPDFCQQAVSCLWNLLDNFRVSAFIENSLAQLDDALRQLIVRGRLVRPDGFEDSLARDQFAVRIDEMLQDGHCFGTQRS